MYACGSTRRLRGIRKHTGRIGSSPVALSAPAVSPSARSDWQGVRQGLATLTDRQADIRERGLCIPVPVFFFSPSVSSGVFICCYSKHQFDIMVPVRFCVRIVCSMQWRHSAPILRGIFFHGGEGRWLLWDIPWGVEDIGAISFCCSLIFIRSPPRCSARFSLFPSFSFSYVRSRGVSLVVSSSRLVMPSRSRASRPSSRLSCCRFVPSVRFACRLVLAPFRSAVRSFLSYSCPVVLPYLVGSSLARCVLIPLIRSKKTNETETAAMANGE